jgi:hypothetical protein
MTGAVEFGSGGEFVTTPKQWLGWTDLGSGDPGLDNSLKGLGGSGT